jgi:hypothetical protein
MGIAGVEPCQLAPTVGTTRSGSTDSPAPSPTITNLLASTRIDGSSPITVVDSALPTAIDIDIDTTSFDIDITSSAIDVTSSAIDIDIDTASPTVVDATASTNVDTMSPTIIESTPVFAIDTMFAIWLDDFITAVTISGRSRDNALQLLSLHLKDNARAWLNNLAPDSIRS